MAGLTIESIWHFIGYLRLPGTYDKLPPHFSGGSLHEPFELHFPWSPQPGPAPGLEPARPGRADDVGLEGPGRDKDFHHVPQPPATLRPVLTSTDIADLERLPEIARPQPAEGGGGGGSGGIVVSVGYRTVGGNDFAAVLEQRNLLLDDDLVGNAAALLRWHGASGDGLAPLIARVEGLVPAGVLEPAFTVAGLDVALRSVRSPDGLEVEPAAGTGAAPAAVAPGRYVGGVRQAEAETLEEHMAAVRSAIGRAQERQDGDDGGATDGTPADQELTAVTTTPAPASQAVTLGTGANELLNVAVLGDYAEMTGARIVAGDWHETNAIVQINVLQNGDAGPITPGDGVALAARAVAAVLAGPDEADTLVNEATFLADPAKPGGVALGTWPGATTVLVDVVEGDVVDVTAILQGNGMRDADTVSPADAARLLTVVAGGNAQYDIAQLIQLAEFYDLIVIGGDYLSYNAIVQLNIVLDDDRVVAGGPGGFAPTISGNGNALINDAAIVNVGDNSPMPLAGAAAELADALEDGERSIDPELLTGLPGNGTGVYRVLYITGDYYDVNLIVQANVLSDADVVLLEPAAGAGPLDEGLVPIEGALGANSASNLAIIVDHGALSDYQFVGGSHFEESFLLQADIIIDSRSEDGARGEDDADLDGDAVATIAALIGGESEAAPASSTIPSSTAHPGEDVLGGTLH